MNPVALRELQERWRTLRSPVLLGVWVLIAAVLTYLAYEVARRLAEAAFSGQGFLGLGSILASSSMGRFMMQVILLGLLTAVVFVVPGQAAVAIVGERERRTLKLLQVSQLSAFGIVAGKLMSSLAYIGLLLVATTPLLVIPVLLGGIGLRDVLAGMGMIAAAAVMVGAVAMWVSARARSVQGAVLASYVWAAFLFFGTLALLVGEFLLLAPDDQGRTRYDGGYPRDAGRELYTAWINPYLGLVDATSEILTFDEEMIASPYVPFRAVLLERQGYEFGDADNIYRSQLATTDTTIAPGFPQPGGGTQVQTPNVRRVEPIRGGIWWRTLTFEAVVTLLALLGAAWMVKTPRRRLSRRMREAADDS